MWHLNRHLNRSDLFRRARLIGGTARHPMKSKVASVDGMGLKGRLTGCLTDRLKGHLKGRLRTVSGLLLHRPRSPCCHR